MKDFLKTNIGKTFVVAFYIGLSSVISLVVSSIANDPSLFGPLTPVINVVLVLVVKTLDEKTPNLSSK